MLYIRIIYVLFNKLFAIMKTALYTAASRGHMDHGWLDTHHTFSFASYYDPDRMHFGALRVLNDDIVVGGEGFGTHPHDNMEIISIPIAGDLEHRDSMGHHGVIKAGDVQVMSAGTGVRHSEFDASQIMPVNFFQIWIIPNKRNVEPRYQQMTLDFLNTRNRLTQIVTPNPQDDVLWIHQDAWLSSGEFDEGASTEYAIKRAGNGVFVMVIDGEFTVEGQKLGPRDGLAVWDTDRIKITADTPDARILLIDVPLIEL